MAERVRFGWLFAVAGAIVACSSSGGHADLVRLDPVAPGSICPAGGVAIVTGQDGNGNGMLEASEVSSTTPVCAAPAATLVQALTEPSGPHCADGGVAIESGVDTSRDGVLQAAEVTSTTYVCSPGAATPTLVNTLPEPAGANCPAGGVAVESGADANHDSLLQPGEVTATNYVCSAAAANLVAVRTVPEPAGTNCANGGTAVESGIDDNRDGVLQAGEVDSTAYVCTGEPAAPGSLVNVATEPMGTNCPAGGLRVDTGADVNSDHVLEVGEVTASNYVCNGAVSGSVSYAQRLAESPPVATHAFGRMLALDGDTLAVASSTFPSAPATLTFFHRATNGTWSQEGAISGVPQTPVALRGGVAMMCESGGLRFFSRDASGAWASSQLLAGIDGTCLEQVGIGDGFAVALTSIGIDILTQSAVTGLWSVLQFLPQGSTARFGNLAVNGTTLAVQYVLFPTTGPVTSAGVRIFVQIPATGLLALAQDITSPLPVPFVASFGATLLLDGDRMVVSGDPQDTSVSAYAYEQFVGQGFVNTEIVQANAGCGSVLALHGDMLACNGRVQNVGGPDVHLLTRDPIAGWTDVQRIVAPELGFQGFGSTGVALDDAQVFVAAQSASLPSSPSSGAVHVYNRLR
jgi:hypothetical protein